MRWGEERLRPKHLSSELKNIIQLGVAAVIRVQVIVQNLLTDEHKLDLRNLLRTTVNKSHIRI